MAWASSIVVPAGNSALRDKPTESLPWGKMLKPSPPAKPRPEPIAKKAKKARTKPTSQPFGPFPDGYAASRPAAAATDFSARMIGLFGFWPLSRKSRPITGMNTTENRNDSSSVIITVAGMGRMNSPRMPPMNNIGENTTTVVSVPANDAAPTRSMARRTTPTDLISSDESGSSLLASIDSDITMASSTSSPSVRIKPNRVIVLSV